jgi:hypothetical protein
MIRGEITHNDDDLSRGEDLNAKKIDINFGPNITFDNGGLLAIPKLNIAAE